MNTVTIITPSLSVLYRYTNIYHVVVKYEIGSDNKFPLSISTTLTVEFNSVTISYNATKTREL